LPSRAKQVVPTMGKALLPTTVKWGESGLAGRVGTKFRSSKTTHLHEHNFWFSEALRTSIENSHCTTENSPLQSILCFQASSQLASPVPTRPTLRYFFQTFINLERRKIRKRTSNDFDRYLLYLSTYYCIMLFCRISSRFQVREVWNIWEGAILLPLISGITLVDCQAKWQLSGAQGSSPNLI